MNNKIFRLVLGFIFLWSIFASPFSVFAQTAANQPSRGVVTTVDGNKAVVKFEELNYRDRTMVSPYDSTSLLFSLPPTWRLASGSEVSIDYEITFSGSDMDKFENGKNPFGGTLSVVYNRVIIGSIPLDENGSKTISLAIPADALIAPREDGRHQITITLDAPFSCDYDVYATVIIKNTSFFNLAFETIAPVLDLSKLPSPFYQANSILPEQTLLVTPDKPATQELQSALNIMAGLGSLSGDTFLVDLVKNSELTAPLLAESNLIFVGLPGQFPQLSQVSFPLRLAGGQFVNLPETSAEDGVLQLAVSPWNPNKVILLVSGNTEAALQKAAYAVSSGKIMVYSDPTYSLIKDVELLVQSVPVVEDFNFDSLGYDTETMSGIGLKSLEYTFLVAKEQIATQEAYLDLAYYHSGLVNYNNSSISISLNDQLINASAFKPETEQLSTLRIKFPPGLLRYGVNTLEVSSRMQGLFFCETSGFSDPWMVVSDQSRLHIPITEELNIVAETPLDLKYYPAFLFTDENLSDLAFILAEEDSTGWKVAAELSYYLGLLSNPGIPDIQLAYSSDVPAGLKNRSSIIVVGKANTQPFLAEVNNKLPAPFDLQTNTATERDMQIVYRIPVGVSVGYLELLSSPYNAEKKMLVISGNDDDGVKLAGDVLLGSDLAAQLGGLFAITNGTQVTTSNSNASSVFSIVGAAIPAAEAVVTTPIPAPSLLPQEPTMPPPAWLMPFFIGSGLLVLLIAAVVIGSALIRNRSIDMDAIAERANAESREPGEK